ncbi:hypothetical protein [Polaribacter sp. R77954]
MKNQDSSTVLTATNRHQNYSNKKESMINQFVTWFREFLENAE